jgi:hypothetical protein
VERIANLATTYKRVKQNPRVYAVGMRIVTALAVAVLCVGCSTAPPAPAPTAAPDLRGGWTGTWGGAPLTVVITDQLDDAPYSGLYVGPWLVSGRRVPGMSGVMTYTDRAGHHSVSFNGWFVAQRPLDIRIIADAPDGMQKLKLTLAEPDRLIGDGETDNSFGPRGPIELTRTARRP